MLGERGFSPRPGQEYRAPLSGPGLPGAAGGNGESAGEGNAFDIVCGLTLRQRRLNVPSIDEYVKMWKGLSALTIDTPQAAELRIKTTPQIHEMIGHVSRGLDFVLFYKIGATQRGSILREVREERREEGTNEYILTYEEGLILRDAAAAVNVTYDPGTPEEVEKRTFRIADLEQRAVHGDTPQPEKVVDADQ